MDQNGPLITGLFRASQSDKFTSLDNFKNIKTMYVVNDENFEDVKSNLSNLSESDVLTISVFKNAVAGILEEIQREKRDTLWLFCFLNASHPRYRQCDADDTDLFQSLLPLYQNDQVSFFWMTQPLYGVIVQMGSIPEIGLKWIWEIMSALFVKGLVLTAF